MRRGAALFDIHGVPTYTTPTANHYLTYKGIVTMTRGRVPEAITTPFGAPLPPVPIIAPAPITWRTPAQAIAAQQGNLSGVSGLPTFGTGSCGCKCGINH